MVEVMNEDTPRSRQEELEAMLTFYPKSKNKEVANHVDEFGKSDYRSLLNTFGHNIRRRRRICHGQDHE